MFDFQIIRSVNCNYLFNLISDNKVIMENVPFELIQDYFGIVPENYSNIDDNHYLMLI